jgi:hypothetical protein
MNHSADEMAAKPGSLTTSELICRVLKILFVHPATDVERIAGKTVAGIVRVSSL